MGPKPNDKKRNFGMNFRIKNFKKAKQAQATQDQATQAQDINAAQVTQGYTQAELTALLAANAEVQAVQTEAIAQVQAEIAQPAEIALSPDQEALVKAYMEREKAARIKRMHEGKARKAEEKRQAEEKRIADEKAQAELAEKFKEEQARLAEQARVEREAKETEQLKARKTALEKKRDRLADELAVQTLEAEVQALQAKVGKAQTHSQATKEPTKTVITERKPKLYDDNFIVAMRKQELLKAASKPTSKSVRMYVLINGQKVPMKDAFRAITGSKATNDELDSSAIARFFDKHGIKYVRES